MNKKIDYMFLAFFAITALISCGGGGSSSPSVQSTIVSGTAAMGAPIVSAPVEVRDKDGNKKSGVTNSAGKYSVDVKGLAGPYLVLVTTGTGTKLYSISSSVGTINVHPFTSLIVKDWYKVKGLDIDTAFAAAGTLQVPTAIEIDTIESVLRSIIMSWLKAAGVNTAAFNLITSPFDANGSGFDKVLEILLVNIASGTITITPVDQSGTAGNPIASLSETADLSANPLQAMMVSVNQTLGEWMSIVNSNPTATVGDLVHLYYPVGYLNMGMSVTADITDTLSPNNHPGAMSVFSAKDIIAYDDATKVVSVTIEYSAANWGSGVLDAPRAWNFKYDSISGRWLFYGDQMIAGIDLTSGVMKTVTGGGSTLSYMVDPEAWAPSGTVTQISVAGPALVNNPTILTKLTGSSRDDFYLPGDGATSIQPLIGSVYTFTLTKSGGGTEVYKKTLYGTTTETFNITTPTGHALPDAKLGGTLNVSWTLPTSFSVHRPSLFGGVSGSNGNCMWQDGTTNSDTTGFIALPTMCNGVAVTNAWIAVYIGGPNAIESVVNYQFF